MSIKKSNEQYNLIKMMHRRLKDLWLIDKHFSKDAKCATCKAMIKSMRADLDKHVALIDKEMKKHW